MASDHASELHEALRKFAGREVFLSMGAEDRFGNEEKDRESVKKALSELRDRLQEHPGVLAGRPTLVRRWFAPPGSISGPRLKQWTQSRQCLIEVLTAMFETEESQTSGSAFLLSLAHTKGFAAVAGAFVRSDERPHLIGLGLDVEPRARPTGAAVAEKIRNPEDRVDALDLITVWTAKEACFKADPKPDAGLSGYALKCYRDGFESGPLQALGDRSDFRIWVEDVGDFRLAVALAYASHPLAVVQHETVEKGWRHE